MVRTKKNIVSSWHSNEGQAIVKSVKETEGNISPCISPFKGLVLLLCGLGS